MMNQIWCSCILGCWRIRPVDKLVRTWSFRFQPCQFLYCCEFLRNRWEITVNILLWNNYFIFVTRLCENILCVSSHTYYPFHILCVSTPTFYPFHDFAFGNGHMRMHYWLLNVSPEIGDYCISRFFHLC